LRHHGEYRFIHLAIRQRHVDLAKRRFGHGIQDRAFDGGRLRLGGWLRASRHANQKQS
jgi:hypothetical protein